jgi:hypothetical protein
VGVSRSAYVVVVACLLLNMPWGHGDAQAQEADSPELRLRATNNLAFVPAEMLFTGRLRGGADDDEEYYCLSAEWDWDDGTISESTFDCEPYEPGASEIRRRFSRRHTFTRGGRYEVRLTLKRGGDIVASARTSIRVQGL